MTRYAYSYYRLDDFPRNDGRYLFELTEDNSVRYPLRGSRCGDYDAHSITHRVGEHDRRRRREGEAQ
jgi:hypothetical protein